MVTRRGLTRALLGRRVAVAFGVIATLYLVRVVRVQPLQIPAYLLIVAYDLVEVVLPVLTPYHPVAFPMFLYCLAVFAAATSRTIASLEREPIGTVRGSIGGVSLLIGLLSVLFGLYIGGPLMAPTDNPTPLAITGSTGVVLLALGWVLLGRPRGRPN